MNVQHFTKLDIGNVSHLKCEPGFLVKHKLPSIFTSNFHEVQQTNSFLHDTFKNIGSPYLFLYNSYLKLMTTKNEFRGKSQKWVITIEIQSFLFHQICVIERFLYVVHKTGKKAEVTMHSKEILHAVDFHPIAVSQFNNGTNFLN